MTFQLYRPRNGRCGAGEPWPRDAAILEAASFATRMHGDQKRKWPVENPEPYMIHCFEVANTVSMVAKDVTMIAAALLHDTVEDTTATIKDIKHEFGARIMRLVDWLTDVSEPEDGNRAARKLIDREHIAAAPSDAKTIKLADLISNTQSIVRYDPGFAKIYLPEKRLLLDEALREGDARLWRIADNMVTRGLQELEKLK